MGLSGEFRDVLDKAASDLAHSVDTSSMDSDCCFQKLKGIFRALIKEVGREYGLTKWERPAHKFQVGDRVRVQSHSVMTHYMGSAGTVFDASHHEHIGVKFDKWPEHAPRFYASSLELVTSPEITTAEAKDGSLKVRFELEGTVLTAKRLHASPRFFVPRNRKTKSSYCIDTFPTEDKFYDKPVGIACDGENLHIPSSYSPTHKYPSPAQARAARDAFTALIEGLELPKLELRVGGKARGFASHQIVEILAGPDIYGRWSVRYQHDLHLALLEHNSIEAIED